MLNMNTVYVKKSTPLGLSEKTIPLVTLMPPLPSLILSLAVGDSILPVLAGIGEFIRRAFSAKPTLEI